jgi:rare lipoprotein A
MCAVGFLVAAGGETRASETCIASVFSEGYGSPMADGRRHSTNERLVAHRALPFGTVIRITRLDNGASATATVRDRGPFIRSRCVDLSPATARDLGFSGLARVTVEVISAPGQLPDLNRRSVSNEPIGHRPERQSK